MSVDTGEIKCVCRNPEDDGFTIQCDSCLVWQHVGCVGISKSNIPDFFYCHLCLPSQSEEAIKLMEKSKKRPPGRPPLSAGTGKRGRPRLNPVVSKEENPNESTISENISSISTNPDTSVFVPSSKALSSSSSSSDLPHVSNSKHSSAANLAEPKSDYLLEYIPLDESDSLRIPAELEDVLSHYYKLINSAYLKKKSDLDISAERVMCSRTPLYSVDYFESNGVILLDKSVYNSLFIKNATDNLALKGAKMSSIQQKKFIIPRYGVFSRVDIEIRKIITEVSGNLIRKSFLSGEYFTSGYDHIYCHSTTDLGVDARFLGNISRFIRRSCRPNADLKLVFFKSENFSEIIENVRFVVVARSFIPAGEELCIPLDYAYNPVREIGTLLCSCLNIEFCLAPNEKSDFPDLLEKHQLVTFPCPSETSKVPLDFYKIENSSLSSSSSISGLRSALASPPPGHLILSSNSATNGSETSMHPLKRKYERSAKYLEKRKAVVTLDEDKLYYKDFNSKLSREDRKIQAAIEAIEKAAQTTSSRRGKRKFYSGRNENYAYNDIDEEYTEELPRPGSSPRSSESPASILENVKKGYDQSATVPSSPLPTKENLADIELLKCNETIEKEA